MAIDKVVLAIANLFAAPITLGGDVLDKSKIGVGSPGGPVKDKDIILFPYLVTPDAAQRNKDRVRAFPNGANPPEMVMQVVKPAVPIELRILVTLGSASDGDANLLSRLAHAIRTLEAASPLSLPVEFQPAIWLSLMPMDTDELSRIWGLFPDVNCRPSFAFRASPIWIDPLEIASLAPPVTRDQLDSNRLAEPA